MHSASLIPPSKIKLKIISRQRHKISSQNYFGLSYLFDLSLGRFSSRLYRNNGDKMKSLEMRKDTIRKHCGYKRPSGLVHGKEGEWKWMLNRLSNWARTNSWETAVSPKRHDISGQQTFCPNECICWDDDSGNLTYHISFPQLARGYLSLRIWCQFWQNGCAHRSF